MRLARQATDPGRRNHAGFTLIELLEFILAMTLAVWLAGRLASPFHGMWRAVVFRTAALVGTAVFGFSILIGLAYVFEDVERRTIERRASRKPTHNSDEPEEDRE